MADRCFRNCLNCRSQPPGRRRGRGKPRSRPVADAPAEGEPSFVEQAFQRADYAPKARQLLEAFQKVRALVCLMCVCLFCGAGARPGPLGWLVDGAARGPN